MKSKILLAFVSLFFSAASLASAGGHLDHAKVDVSDQQSLQRGATMFVNYCMGCHSAGYMRYNQMSAGLGLSETEIMDTLMPANAKIAEHMNSAMPAADATVWFGTAPPDLSLVARSRGVDWLYTYLRSFYKDDSRPFGVNNRVFADVGMPNVLWELQGIQVPVYETVNGIQVIEKLALETPGTMSPEEYDAAVLDLVSFLSYIAEPIQLERQALGIKVLIFLAIFLVIAYLLKKEYWKDIH
ncbi:MAG: cytochrome c1 [Gammaproteobacteria bacterium]|nr:cytochrome c1 [Gammaproteobacteria bacterium]